MSKKTKKNKKDIPVITWVDHDDVDDWIENNLQNMFRPTSSYWRPAPSGNPGWSWSLLIAVYNLLTLMCVSP